MRAAYYNKRGVGFCAAIEQNAFVAIADKAVQRCNAWGREREREREGVKARATFCNRRIYIYRASDGAERKVNGKLEKYSTTEFCELVYS